MAPRARLAFLPQLVRRGSRLTKLARLLAQMVLRAQLALMGAAGDPTAAHATSALRARLALLTHGRRRSATKASAEVLRPRRRRDPHQHELQPLQHRRQDGPHPQKAVRYTARGQHAVHGRRLHRTARIRLVQSKAGLRQPGNGRRPHLPGGGRLPHQHHCGRRPARSSEDETD
jgi:hypothetical protein